MVFESRLIEVLRKHLDELVQKVWEDGVVTDEEKDLIIDELEEYGIRDAGYRAIETLRLEKAFRAWGSDLTPDTTPLEAGLGFAVTEIRQVGPERMLPQPSYLFSLPHRVHCSASLG